MYFTLLEEAAGNFFVIGDGEVILKKYSPIGGLTRRFRQVINAESFPESTGQITLIPTACLSPWRAHRKKNIWTRRSGTCLKHACKTVKAVRQNNWRWDLWKIFTLER